MPAVDDFLKTVLRSGLLDREQLQQSLRSVPVEQRADPEVVANHLVKAGKLTRFQSRKLLQGAAFGLILGPFQVLAPIGKGGMGTVYLARDERSGHLVALKVLSPKCAREEGRKLARFRREMEMCQRVAHPYIAWTCDVGKHQGVYFIAMEYIPGKSLSRLVGAEGPLPVPRAARLLAEVAAALDHAHHQGIIHRDIKPSNIIVTPNDHAKLLDLGLALAVGESGAREVVGGQGYVIGTMDYLSPEQADDATQVDGRSDLYSLGCTAYFAVTGRPPFPGGTTAEKIQRHHHDEPTPIPQLNANVPPGFIGLIRRLMAKKPEQRPAAAAAVREELLAWAGGEQALPLDRPEDAGYRDAVARLQTAEPSTELNGEVLPAATPPPAPVSTDEVPAIPDAKPLPGVLVSSPPTPPPPVKRRGRPSSLALNQSARPPRPPEPPARRRPLLAVVVLLGALGAAAVAGVGLLLWHLLG
jgi:serine/threonine protein kinase